MPDVTIHELDVMREANWSFRRSEPVVHRAPYSSSGAFDPFPAYAHERRPVADAVAHVIERCPPLWNVDIFLADREEAGRSNGYSDIAEPQHYDEADGCWVRDTPAGLIMMSGKRVPPHPAMSRYLVAHEYGHHVEWFLEHARGHRLRSGAIVAGYAKMRGLASVHHGSGGRWHDSVDEVFACDFRIVVCDVETEFWPHPGIPRPEDCRAPVRDWWADALDAMTQFGSKAEA